MSGRVVRLRIGLTMASFAVAFMALGVRAAHLTLVDGDRLRVRALRQHTRTMARQPRRGTIVDREGNALGLTRESIDVFVRPADFQAEEGKLRSLARFLEMPVAEVRKRVRSSSPFVWLKRRVSEDAWAKIRALDIGGLDREKARERVYPRGSLAGHVLGFTGVDGQGLEGIERYFDRDLRGEGDALYVERDARGRHLVLGEGGVGPLSRVGAKVEVTLDADIQHVAELELEKTVAEFGAKAGSAIVMDVGSGEVLAMANVPRFDPNTFRLANASRWRNRTITDVYEPGSTFKAILAAAALREGSVAPDEMIDCGGGSLRIGRRTIHDHHSFEMLTFSEVIANSSNIGCARVGARLGRERLGAAFSEFGFARKTGISLPGEVSGIVRPVESWKPIDLATASFGQGVAATPLQVVNAFAAIANRGVMMRPFIVRRVVSQDGRVLRRTRPTVINHLFGPDVADQVTEILIRVVEDGTGKQAKVPGFEVAGKTGTSQKVDGVSGRYHATDRIASFVGFVPARDPALAILVLVDTPTRRSTYGGEVAGPAFRRIAKFALGKVRVYPDGRPTSDGTGPTFEPPVGEPQDERGVEPNFKSGEPALLQAAYQSGGTGDGSRPALGNGIPSFIGMAMRAALVRAQDRGLDVRIEGSGYVVSQDPAPGSASSEGLLSLVFAAEH